MLTYVLSCLRLLLEWAEGKPGEGGPRKVAVKSTEPLAIISLPIVLGPVRCECQCPT